MRTPRLAAIAAPFLLGSPAAAQVCAPILPSGQPALMMVAPICGPVLLPAPVVWAFGNPAFSVAVPPLPMVPFTPVFLVLGVASPPVAIPAIPLDPILGVPGLLTMLPGSMSVIPSAVLPAPAPVVFALPIPPTGGPMGVVSVHAGFFTPAFLAGLTGATSITI